MKRQILMSSESVQQFQVIPRRKSSFSRPSATKRTNLWLIYYNKGQGLLVYYMYSILLILMNDFQCFKTACSHSLLFCPDYIKIELYLSSLFLRNHIAVHQLHILGTDFEIELWKEQVTQRQQSHRTDETQSFPFSAKKSAGGFKVRTHVCRWTSCTDNSILRPADGCRYGPLP